MRHPIFWLAVLFVAAGCSSTSVVPQKTLALVDAGIVATAPAGYCVDPAASDADAGFAVMAPCATLGGTDTPPDVLGVATLQVGPADSGAVTGSEDALVSLFASDAGAVLLSAQGDPDLITVNDADKGENTVTVQFTDRGAPPIAGLGVDEWRGFTDINGRLVTVGVRGLAAAPLADGTGMWLLNLIMTGLVGTGNT